MTSSDSVKAPGTIEGWLQADLVPLRARDLDVIAQEAARLRARPRTDLPLGGGDPQLRCRLLRDPADVMLVQMRQDRGTDIGQRIPEHPELAGERGSGSTDPGGVADSTLVPAHGSGTFHLT